MIGFMKKLLKTLFVSSHSKCYDMMEDRGIAVFDCCCGLVGGDANTNHLQYHCIDCPYYVENQSFEMKRRSTHG